MCGWAGGWVVGELAASARMFARTSRPHVLQYNACVWTPTRQRSRARLTQICPCRSPPAGFLSMRARVTTDRRRRGACRVPFEELLDTFERLKRLLKREPARRRYGRQLRKKIAKQTASRCHHSHGATTDSLPSGGNRFGIVWNRNGSEYPHSPAPRLVVIAGQLVDMEQA